MPRIRERDSGRGKPQLRAAVDLLQRGLARSGSGETADGPAKDSTHMSFYLQMGLYFAKVQALEKDAGDLQDELDVAEGEAADELQAEVGCTHPDQQ